MFKIEINLQLFNDGDGAIGDVDVAEGVTDSPSENQGVDSQAPADDRATKWAELKSQYKSEYDAEVQALIKDRVKNSSKQSAQLKAQLKSYEPIFEYLGSKYSVNPSDTEAILRAFENDDSILEQEAYERGFSVEQLKSIKNVERENARLKAERDEQLKEAQFNEWNRQAEELKNIYPNFSLEEAMADDNIVQMIGAGVPMRKAYEVAHMDDLMSGAMQYTAAQVAQKVSNSIVANQTRPSENGLGSNATSVQKVDISNMTLEQMNELNRRARAGERIDFKYR